MLYSLPLSFELQAPVKMCFIEEFYSGDSILINYNLTSQLPEGSQTIIFEFLDKKTLRPIHGTITSKIKEHKILYVHNSTVNEIKICTSLSNGKGTLGIFYTYDNFMDAKIPTKEDSMKLEDNILKAMSKLRQLKRKQKRMQRSEQKHFRYNDALDKKIIVVTIVEAVVIVLAFFVEYCILRNYLKNKEII